MKSLFKSPHSSPFATVRKQKLKVTTYVFLIIFTTCLQWEYTLADPESVEGLLADNIDHSATANQPLKTKKKQYPLTEETRNGNKNSQPTKPQKLHEIQAQKHQKLLNAIEENDLPRIISSSRGQKSPSSAIRNLLANNEARARNEYASDLAARNINFLNERARPQQNQGGFGKPTSGNDFPKLLKGKEKDLSRFHPDTIGRISFRGKNGKSSKPFGKFLQNYPSFQQSPWANNPSQLPHRYQNSQPFQRFNSENFLYPNGLPPVRYGLPKDTYKEKENNESPQNPTNSQNWNGRVNLIKNVSPASNGETKNHKWPIQPKAPTSFDLPINNEKSDKSANSKINSGTKINRKQDKIMPKPTLQNKVPQKTIPVHHKSKQEEKSTDNSPKMDSSMEQNLNQIPENSKTENNNVDTANPISSPSPIIMSSTTSSIKQNQKGTPKVEMLKADKKAFDIPFDTSEIPRDSVSALVIGMTFVVIFIVMALGLVGHSIYSKLRSCGERDTKEAYFGGNVRGRFMRSPNEEDRTPPELRSGCGAPSFVQPELSNSLGNSYGNSRNGGPKGANMDQNGVSQPFFNGKLIFHEVNSNNTSMRDKYPGMNGINSHLPNMNGHSNTQYLGKPGEHLGAIPKKMPSPAANVQITDDLISPKYDDKDDHRNDSTESEEEDSSDDTVYECPGLAASSGDDIVVANPFFMPGQNFTPLVPTPNSPARKAPQPISKNEFHRGITGFN